MLTGSAAQRWAPRWLVLAGLAVLVPPAGAQVFAGIDAQGRLQVRQGQGEAGLQRFDPLRAPAAVPARAPTASTGKPPVPATPPREQLHDGLILQVARQQGLDPHLLHAVIRTESNYRAGARSRAGALGLMQVMPATGRRFGATDLYDPLQNLQAGARYLRWLARRFNGDLPLVLAAYNAGEGAVQRHGNQVPPYRETRAYVQRVTGHYLAASVAAKK